METMISFYKCYVLWIYFVHASCIAVTRLLLPIQMNGKDSKPIKLCSATLMTKLIIYSFINLFCATHWKPPWRAEFLHELLFTTIINYYCKNSHPVFHCAWRPFYSFGPALRSSSYHWEKEVSCSWISATTAFDMLQARLELRSLYFLG